jgi:expansin (peptidoglycan-binding protein)
MPSLTQLLLTLCATTIVLGAPTPASTDNDNGATFITQRSAAYNGDITYYEPGLGACGWTNQDSEAVVALSPAQYSGNCGKHITIHKDGKTTRAKVVDKCPGCASGAIDVSSSVFKTIADLSVGRTSVSWSFD